MTRSATSDRATADDYGNPDPEWLKVDWRERRRNVELAGARVNYVEMGEGPPILFIHGMSGCWQNWLENIPHFARAHRAIALDLPGFGRSPLPSWEVSVPAYGRLLHDFCEKLGLDRCVAVGNSMGGFAATEAALTEPGRFDRLVLVAPAGVSFAEADPEQAERFLWLSRRFGPLFSRFRRAGFTRRRARRLAFSRVVDQPERLRSELLFEQLEPSRGSPGFDQAVRSLAGYDARERLAELEIPTLIVWGRDDRILPVAAAADYQRRIAGSRLEIFERTGHLPQLERPARFNELVDEFLAQ